MLKSLRPAARAGEAAVGRRAGRLQKEWHAALWHHVRQAERGSTVQRASVQSKTL